MTKPNEPTLTCSEVVERLAACARLSSDSKHIVWDRAVASTILHEWEATRLKELQALCDVDYGMDLVECIKQRIEWRERRVQELEEALDDVLSLAKAYLEGKSEKWMNELGYPYQDAVDKADKLLTKSEWREQIRKGQK